MKPDVKYEGESDFTVHLVVRVRGPEHDWDRIAQALAQRIRPLSWDGVVGPCVVVNVEIDEAE